MSSSPYISKSKFLWGLQCPKLLWHAYNAKELIPQPDAATQAIFDQGHDVGGLAKRMFPDGIEIGKGIIDLKETIRLTQPTGTSSVSNASRACRSASPMKWASLVRSITGIGSVMPAK